MFLENDYARPLFDFVKGGPPQGFRCLMPVRYENWKLHQALERPVEHQCGKVTRTERGMRMHLKKVHNWKEQPSLYSTESPNEVRPGAPRKLRAGPPNLNSNEKSPSTETTSQKKVAPETSEGELLRIMREEK